jgi:hypothetical protein
MDKALELADLLDFDAKTLNWKAFADAATMLRQQQEQIDKLTAIVALREMKIERMVEDRSKYEALAHAGGVETGKELAQAEIEALRMMLANRNEIIDRLDLK